MGKRKQLSTALHSEFSEYSSLLRALRTSKTLDVVSHLTKVQPSTAVQQGDDDDGGSIGENSDLDDEELIDEGTISPVELDSQTRELGSAEAGPSTRVKTVAGSKRKRKPSHKRDTWTRWPLLAGDVHVPEWGLEDEIKILASQSMKSHPHRSKSQTANDSDLDSDSDIESQPWLSSLTQVSSTYLSQILVLLAAHIPLAEKSLQNRINPIGWEMVLDVVSAKGNGFVDEKTIASVKNRMEAIYGPSQSMVVDRARESAAAKRKRQDLYSMHELSFLHLVAPDDVPPPRKKRQSTRIAEKQAHENATPPPLGVQDSFYFDGEGPDGFAVMTPATFRRPVR